MFRVIVAYLLCASLRYVSALSSERNLMRSEGSKGKQAAHFKDEDDDGDDRDDSSELEDEPDNDEKDASLVELGSEDEADEDHRHKDGSEYEEGELEDEGEEGDDSEQEGDDDGSHQSRNSGHENEREEDDEGGEDDDAMWAEDVHYIAGPVLQEFEDIRRDSKNVTAEYITRLLSEEHLKTLSENESMFGLKLVGLPEDAHTMGFDEFVEHASPAKFIDLVLKSKENYTGTDADPGVLTLVQFQARNKENGRGEHDEPEREDMHFLPESTYKNLESLSSSHTNISKEALEEILSDERLEKLPDSEAIVQVRIENCPDPLPELLNQIEPAAFLDKVVKGKAAVTDPKNLTLGELRKFQAEDEQSIAQEDEHEDDSDRDHHDDEGSDSKADDSKESKDDGAHNEEKDQDGQTQTKDPSDESQQSDNVDEKAAEIEKADDHAKDDAGGEGNKAPEKSDDANPDSVTS